jgi:uncharacterized protein YdeI (YjbR/CyaY-like superfamily)
MEQQMKPIFFSSQSEFRKWLEENHKTENEILVGFRKVTSGSPNMTWSQSVDQALCFGWIDGVRKSLDKHSYCIRFTPRKMSSNWSAINIRKIEELQKQGLMHPSGNEAYNNRKEAKTGVYSFENRKKPLPEDLENHFKANKTAWEFFIKQAPSYQKTMIFWINSAKQESTRFSRLETLIAECNKGKRIGDQYKRK